MKFKFINQILLSLTTSWTRAHQKKKKKVIFSPKKVSKKRYFKVKGKTLKNKLKSRHDIHSNYNYLQSQIKNIIFIKYISLLTCATHL